MANLLLIGAGKSATTLIDYLLNNAVNENWSVTVADMNLQLAEQKVNFHSKATAVQLDVSNLEALEQLIIGHDLVISMLPAFMHMEVARFCLKHKKHMATASYVSDEMEALDAEAKQAGIIMLNEVGLDPGVDHMTAMQTLDKLRNRGCTITGFETFTGGLMAPESENNPWKYKFTWNPRNVVMAASGGAVKFLQGGKYKYIPYHKVFRRTEVIEIDGFGEFEAYANRDSLKYLNLYNLEGVKTLYRGTLRRVGFSKAWDIFVQLGATDDSYVMENTRALTHREFINSFLFYHPTDSVETKLAMLLKLDHDSDEMRKVSWLGLFKDELVGLQNPSTPAQILQHILEKKWTLEPGEKDMIVMWHKFNYVEHGVPHEMNATLAVKGDDDLHTAMAKTVGIPLGIAVKNIINGNIHTPGVHIPNTKEIYEPILKELETFGIICKEKLVQ
jgi:saccharopine dehydrogenase-like NADP-dependent oxidoreductase